ncbi:geranylgeranyl pyrophosphate synthase [Tumebacillus sp. BK434]|uniref:polyprenyl synthetase family protein n=1 Tax=Tumebacillus sp. BK434 TaxID=2512169 RepID=UPI00104CA892|nr:polyprenyl synthetase family protein [Tumebacillus sp. BK434]TCP52633.1 geranylgeranyl pyrophosphate synthase [Tumebacillus sp. BK434]
MAMCINLHDPFESRLLVIQEELRTALNRVAGVPPSLGEELLSDPKCGLYALLVMLTADAVRAREEEALLAAVSMELLMLAIKGQEAAEDGMAARSKLLAGSFLQTEALSLCADLPPGVVQSFAELCRQLLVEKTRQQNALWPELTERAYLERAYSRSALFAATCGKVGARLGGAASEVEEALTAHGYWLGMALQVQEDLRLVRALPVRAGRAVLQATATGGVVPLPMGSARAVMRSYANKAKKSLSVLPASLAKCMLLDFLNHLFEQPE